jgi:acyl-CoA thioester hydrolase/1,4-dihydroxy-2-naphthoyl-CoA hydrolase
MTNSSSIYVCLIPFHLTDAAGILFFGHVFTLAHQAFEHFVIYQLECPWTFWFQNPDWIVPIKHAEAQYIHPLQAGEECQIKLLVATLSTSSFILSSSFHQQQKVCCIVKTVHVFCHRLTKRKMLIPPFLLPRLQNCLQA